MHLRLPLFLAIPILMTCPRLLSQGPSIPFVGCRSDGQVGPLKPPSGKPGNYTIPTDAAKKLACYKAENGPGVLGPRGWRCFGTYGSSGANLFLSPQPIDAAHIFDENWALNGFAIQFGVNDGGTSGRFAVAEGIARVFPAHMPFARRVIAEGLLSRKHFPRGPWPHDRITRRSPEIVEYETPANQEGFGTHTGLAMTSNPVEGVLVLNTKDDQALYTLALRLPPALSALAPIILQQVEEEDK